MSRNKQYKSTLPEYVLVCVWLTCHKKLQQLKLLLSYQTLRQSMYFILFKFKYRIVSCAVNIEQYEIQLNVLISI